VNSFCPVIRNTSSPHWRGWLQPENRRLVPANSFAEPLFSSINALIICAGDHLLDWRFSDASSFHTGVSRGLRIVCAATLR
jgi:hypothetical protein